MLQSASNCQNQQAASVAIEVIKEIDTDEIDAANESWFGGENYSLFIFGPDNEFRNFIYTVVSSK